MIVGLFPQKPHHAVGFDPHQDRLAVEEDLIETADQHQRPAGAIQLLENLTCGVSRGLDPAMNRRATGTRLGSQENRQQDADLAVAKPHGHGRHGELLLLGQRKLDGLKEPVPQLGVFLAEGFVSPGSVPPRRSAAVFGLDGRFHLFGMVVDGLAAAAGLLGLLCDGAVAAAEARGGIGDPTTKGMVHMGMGPFVCGSG